jgi:hypothetical protein
MANILGKITVNNILIIITDISPMDGIGISAPIGSFGSASDGSGIFYKSGIANTNWINLLSILPSIVQKSADYTPTIFDFTIECTNGTFTITLPTAIGKNGKIYNIVNSGLGTILVITTSSQTINGQLSQPVNAGNSMTVQSNNSNWLII